MLTKLLLSIVIVASAIFIREIPSEQAANGLPSGLIEMFGESVIEPEKDDYNYVRISFDDSRPIEGYYPIYMRDNDTENGAYGYIDSNGKIVIEPQYLQASAFSEGYARVVVEGTYEDLFGVMVTNPVTYINTAGEHCIGYFSGGQNFSENRAVVADSQNNLYLIDLSGTVINKLPDDAVNIYTDLWGNCSVMSDSRFLFISENTRLLGFLYECGNVVIQPGFSDAHSFSEGLAAVELEDSNLGYIDTAGNTVIKTKEAAGTAMNPMFPGEPDCNFHDGIAMIPGGYIDKSGNRVDVGNGTGTYKKGLIASYDYDTHKRGFVNINGENVIPCEYMWVRDFSECGLALVFTNENGPAVENAPDNEYGGTPYRGYINTKGEIVIPIEYYSPCNIGASHMYPVHKGSGGVIELYKEGYTYYFNTDGTVIGKKPEQFRVQYEGEWYPINLAEYYDASGTMSADLRGNNIMETPNIKNTVSS